MASVLEIDAVIDPADTRRWLLRGLASVPATLAPELLRRLEPGMLCLADRAFVGFALWRGTTATGADLLWRVRKNQVLPCCELLPDGSCLSRLHASPQHRRQDRDGVVVACVRCVRSHATHRRRRGGADRRPIG